MAPNAPLRVLLIGAGRRIQNNYMPALRCMPDAFQVVGMHARTQETLRPVAERWDVPAVASLDEVDFDAVDVIAISVPTVSNAPVLRALHQLLPAVKARRLRVVIDTPVAWTKSEFKAVLPELNGFATVAAAEDYMNYPPFELVRRAVAQGLIGRPRSLTLTNTGFLYHGLALARSFVGFEPVLASSRVRHGSLGTSVRYRFRSGFEAHVIGPYRSHTTGGLVLEGDDGVITEFAADAAKDPKRKWYLLSYRRQDGVLSACVLSGPSGEMVQPIPAIAMMDTMPFNDRSDLNLLRSCGLMKVFGSLLDPADMNNGYGPQGALYDGFVSQRATRGNFSFDPFVLLGSNAISAFARAGGLWRGSTG